MKEYMGRPDGATEALENHLHLGYDSKVDFNSLAHRVIVGRKGSGKSLSIRKFYQASQRDNGRFAIEISNRAPNLDSMVRFSATMSHMVRTNSWQSVWDYAILLSAITYVLYDSEFKSKHGSKITKSQIENIEFNYGNCLLGLKSETQVYEVVNVLTNHFDSYEEFSRFLFSPVTSNFRSACNSLLKNVPIICVYLDSLDDEMRRAPSVLTDITRALFYTVIKSARDTDSHNNLHVTITMRDVVFSTIMSSDHADRFLDTNYILFLFWPPQSSKVFLNKKVAQTQVHLHEKDSKWAANVTTLPKLLGFDKVKNDGKGVEESVTQYFLRHTNFVPRNTIRFGNRIYNEIDRTGAISEERFKKIVSDISKEIAGALIKASSAYLVAAGYDDDIGYLVELDENIREYLRKGPVSDDFINEVMENMQTNLTDGFVKPIKSFIDHIGKDVFSRDDLMGAIEKFTLSNIDYRSSVQNFNLNRLENILWIQGLIGIRDSGKAGDRFYYFSEVNEQTDLPLNYDTYVFFPGLNDVCDLAISSGNPVGPKVP